MGGQCQRARVVPAQRAEGEQQDDDFIMFGLCDLGMGFPELGYVSLNELQAITGPLGLGIERDPYWHAQPLSEVGSR